MENRLGLTEYEEVLIDNLSTVVIPRSYIEDNREFWDTVIFKLFEDYNYSLAEVSIRGQAKIVEIIFNSVFSFRPPTEKPQDIINV